MPTLKDHEAVLRAKCLNGTLYRNDAKLAKWLGIPQNEVKYVLDQLVSEAVLRLDGHSRTGTERYKLGPAPAGGASSGDPFAPSQTTASAPWPPACEQPAVASQPELVGIDRLDPWAVPDSGDPNDPFSRSFIPKG